MGLSRRQAEAINDIINEEVQGALQGRKMRGQLLDRSLMNEEYDLDEAGPHPGRVNDSVIKDAVEGGPIGEMASEMAQEMVHQFKKRLGREIAKIINSNNLAADRVDASVIMDDMEDADMDGGMMDVEMECASDVSRALTDLASHLTEFAVHLTGRGEG